MAAPWRPVTGANVGAKMNSASSMFEVLTGKVEDVGANMDSASALLLLALVWAPATLYGLRPLARRAPK